MMNHYENDFVNDWIHKLEINQYGNALVLECLTKTSAEVR